MSNRKSIKPHSAPLPEPGLQTGVWSATEPFCLLIHDVTEDELIAGLNITTEQMQALRLRAADSGQSLSALLSAAIDQAAAPVPSMPKISKGFVMVNMCEEQKKELLELARESGQELRHVLRTALASMRSTLKEWSKLKRLTGLNPDQQARLFRPHDQLN